MSFVKLPFRAHSVGWTSAIYDPRGDRIFSAGADGKVKVFDNIEDPHPMEHVIGEKINAITFREDTIIVATEGTCVHIIQAEDGLPDGIATRFTAEVTHLTLNKDRSRLAACSSDFSIKIVNFLSPDDREFKLEGHSAGVLSVSFDPLDIFLASASCDGTVRIWRLDERKEVKSIRSLSPCSDTALALSACRLCWEASGTFLAVPIDKQICLYERNSWDTLCYLSCPSVTQPVIVCLSSYNGAYMAAGTDDGWLVVWRLKDRHAIHRLRDPSHSAICSLAWHPHLDSLLLCANKNGLIGLVRLSINQAMSNVALSLEAMNDLMGCDEDGDTDELLRAAAAQAESSRLVDEEEAQKLLNLPLSEDDDGDSIDLSRIKSGFLALDEEGEHAGAQGKVEPTGDTSKITEPLMVTAPTLQTLHTQPRFQKAFQPGSLPLSFRERFMVWNRIGVVIQYRGCSPDTEVGNFDDTDSIEVEFHDTTLHHSLRLVNRIGYTMADLGLTALMLASSGSDDPSLAEDVEADEPLDPSDLSQIAVVPLDPHTPGIASDFSSSEWTAKLPAGESCQALCLVPHDDPSERGYAVVATSKQFLRIFVQPTPAASLSRPSTGLHLFQITKLGLPPLSLPGRGVLAMCSHPFKPILAIVVSTFTADLIWRLYYLGGMALGSERSQTPCWLSGSLSTWQLLPLSPSFESGSSESKRTRLMWFGFSDLGGLYTYDSTGLVRRLLHARTIQRPDYHWAPVCDTRSLIKPSNRRSDNYFLVGVLESTDLMSTTPGLENAKTDSTKDSGWGQLQAIYCKASKWPRVFPRPVLSALSFSLPLCSRRTDQADLEESYLRCMVNEDWPVWGPNPQLSSDNQTAMETVELLTERTDRCLVKRKGVLLRLFALAAKLNSDWASLTIARLMPDADTVQLAIRYAGRLRRQHLAQRLAEIALDKERTAFLNEPMDVQNEAEDYGDHSAIANSSRRCAEGLSNPSSPPRLLGTRRRTAADLPSPTPSCRPSQHRISGNQDDQDLNNISLVSSATDVTHDETPFGSLPLAESESFMQSVPSMSTSSTGVRNPFREGPATESAHSSQRRQTSAIRGHGSEILDNWQPKSTDSLNASFKSGQLNKPKEPRSSKRRTPSNSNEASKRKQQKSALTDFPRYLSPSSAEFVDWYEEHRAELEEEYPEKSAEDLLLTARLQFHDFCSKETQISNPTSSMCLDKENVPFLGNKRLLSTSKSRCPGSSKRQMRAAQTSKRLSSFRFEANSAD